MVDEIDSDGNGEIDFDGAGSVRSVCPRMPELTPTSARPPFRVCDGDVTQGQYLIHASSSEGGLQGL